MNKLSIKELNLMFAALALLLIKLIVFPLIDWQDEQLAVINLKQKQLDKAQGLLATKEDIDALYKQSVAEVSGMENRLPLIKLDDFKIEIQKQLTKLFVAKNIRIEQASWIVEPNLGGIFEVTLNLSMSGKMSDFLMSHFAIEKAYPGSKISKLRINVSRHLEKSMGSFRGQVSVSFLVRTEAEKINA